MPTSAFDTPTSLQIQETLNYVLSGVRDIAVIKDKISGQFDTIFGAIEGDSDMREMVFCYVADTQLSRHNRQKFRTFIRAQLGMLKETIIASEGNEKENPELDNLGVALGSFYEGKWWKVSTKKITSTLTRYIELMLDYYNDGEVDEILPNSMHKGGISVKARPKPKLKEESEDEDEPDETNLDLEQKHVQSLQKILRIFQSYISSLDDLTRHTPFKKVLKNDSHRDRWNALSVVVPWLKKLLSHKAILDAMDDQVFGSFSEDLSSIVTSMDGYAMNIE